MNSLKCSLGTLKGFVKHTEQWSQFDINYFLHFWQQV